VRSVDIVEAEYGVPATCGGAREWAVLSGTARPRHYNTAAEYVAACRRLDPGLRRDGERPVDGRLIAAGFRRVPPMEWVFGVRDDWRPPRFLGDFLRWWDQTQPRPGAVGSTYNADPDVAVTLWLAGPAVRRAARRLPPDRWALLVSRDREADELRVSRRALRWLPEIARFARRLSARGWAPDARTARALGSLDPELQRAALSTVRLDDERTVVRVRDIDWSFVAQARNAMARDKSGRVRVAWAVNLISVRVGHNPGNRFMELAEAAGVLFAGRGGWSAWLAPAYPRVPLHIAVRLCRGETPVQISGGLTRSEAHEWLMDGATMEPADWLVRELPDARRLRVHGVAVARWLLDVHRRGGWGGLVRERTMRGPGGRIVRFRYIDRLDEVRDEDLVGEGGTGVDVVFRRAAQRYATKYADQFVDDNTVLHEPPEWRVYPCMRVLNTPAALVREGRELHHCVAGYMSDVRAGRSVIISLDVCGHRSTVELSPDGREVRQHFAEWNQNPHPLCARVLDRFLRRNRLAQYMEEQLG
jgi:hypothetical protein